MLHFIEGLCSILANNLSRQYCLGILAKIVKGGNSKSQQLSQKMKTNQNECAKKMKL